MALEGLAVHSHDVVMPYRGDGVARALCETYAAQADSIPPEMILLLAAIDAPPITRDPG